MGRNELPDHEKKKRRVIYLTDAEWEEWRDKLPKSTRPSRKKSEAMVGQFVETTMGDSIIARQDVVDAQYARTKALRDYVNSITKDDIQ